MRKLVFGLSDQANTNRAVLPQKMARGLKFWILEVEGLYYLCSENKGADQLCGYAASLFLNMQKAGFLITRLILFLEATNTLVCLSASANAKLIMSIVVYICKKQIFQNLAHMLLYYSISITKSYLRNFRFPISTDMALSVMCLNTVLVLNSTLVALERNIKPVWSKNEKLHYLVMKPISTAILPLHLFQEAVVS